MVEMLNRSHITTETIRPGFFTPTFKNIKSKFKKWPGLQITLNDVVTN